MASNVYTCHTISGPVQMRRADKQGRKRQPVELVKVKMAFRALPATKARVIAEAKKYGITPSQYMDLAVSLFDMSKFSSDENC